MRVFRDRMRSRGARASNLARHLRCRRQYIVGRCSRRGGAFGCCWGCCGKTARRSTSTEWPHFVQRTWIIRVDGSLGLRGPSGRALKLQNLTECPCFVAAVWTSAFAPIGPPVLREPGARYGSQLLQRLGRRYRIFGHVQQPTASEAILQRSRNGSGWACIARATAVRRRARRADLGQRRDHL